MVAKVVKNIHEENESRSFHQRVLIKICASAYSKDFYLSANVSSIVSDRGFVFTAIGDDDLPSDISDYLTDKTRQPV